MFNKILIANRGEIACRVIETAQKLGVQTVAIYSDADAHSKHVAMADEAWRVGPPAVSESYLQGEKIIEIAKKSGAEAIHPGYGFLSESPDFVKKVEASGLRFIGPSAKAIRAMGMKDAAKTLMANSGVPVVPGYHGSNQSAEFLKSEAEGIGYPVLIKARAGGGGKGMRKVDRPEDFFAALEGAQREGLSSFGDAHCLVEKWVTKPRHIEIQVFGDDHGNAIHLFERDCSLQRRHQKVIEEAPAPGMTEEMRAAMGEAAVLCAKSISYSGAGTVEFIVDGSEGLRPDRFWFMEMNTRLQVEHPVTEFITGLDLVEWQLRVASGEKLPLDQGSLSLNGHAFEARIYAEDVPSGFLPMTGTISYLSAPTSARIDSGVRAGDTITPWYDPMISKIIVHGETREIALRKMRSALQETRIGGTITNLTFLSKLCHDNDFSIGDVDTGLIERDLTALILEPTTTNGDWTTAAILSLSDGCNDELNGWSLWAAPKQSVWLQQGEEVLELLVAQNGPHNFQVTGPDFELNVSVSERSANSLTILEPEGLRHVFYSKQNDAITLFQNGNSKIFEITKSYSADNATEGSDATIVSPMPGLVKVVAVRASSDVSEGDALVIIEAMKMEHTLKAYRSGIVSEVFVREGQQVEAGEVLVLLADEVE